MQAQPVPAEGRWRGQKAQNGQGEQRKVGISGLQRMRSGTTSQLRKYLLLYCIYHVRLAGLMRGLMRGEKNRTLMVFVYCTFWDSPHEVKRRANCLVFLRHVSNDLI